ncbi:YopX family protein [Levilactobacillus brevis]|nr:YopX family protein [Levilactobacillus brevis]
MMVPKFRAWNMPFGPKGPMQEMVHGKASSILAFAEMSPDEYIVEQSTGLKDANGKEIFEGDVVVPVMTILGKVKRMAHPFEVRASHYVYEKWIATYVSDRGFGVDGWYMGHQIEVIGNVHDNPELLEAQHDTRTD